MVAKIKIGLRRCSHNNRRNSRALQILPIRGGIVRDETGKFSQSSCYAMERMKQGLCMGLGRHLEMFGLNLLLLFFVLFSTVRPGPFQKSPLDKHGLRARCLDLLPAFTMGSVGGVFARTSRYKPLRRYACRRIEGSFHFPVQCKIFHVPSLTLLKG